MSRTTLAFLIAPLVVPIGLMPSQGLDHMPFRDQLAEVAVGFIFWYFYPLLFAVIFALPLFLLLKRYDLVRWWSALIAGIAIGAIGAWSINGQPQLFYVKLVFLGGISGLVFWFIVSQRTRSEESNE